jgi:hypothetical protein
MIWLRARAWFPAACLTPKASRMAINEKNNDTINRGESNPTLKPTAVVNAETVAEWLDGIPPVDHTRFKIRSRFGNLERNLRMEIRALMNWAKNQAVTADKKMGLDMRCRKLSMARASFAEALPFVKVGFSCRVEP